jgi:hypothetical protein
MAGEGGGDGSQQAKWSSASSTDENGVTTTVRGQNGSNTRTVTQTQNGQVINVKRVNRKAIPFISMVDPDGTIRIAAGKPKRNTVPFVTRHNADGTSETVAGKPSRSNVPFITMHHADGTSTTIRGNR